MDINFEILPLVSLKHIVVASHESFCKNLVDYFRQAALEGEFIGSTIINKE
ncbi:Long-chain-fatty-acid--CoA ligase [Crocosphaera watsonii WH 0401]|uniref:Long-chain-fatty-acid--CoA ligase n=1 Tax=Crocosphaera watsonii WH 0401 TaxID=555881 RepID=T2J9Y8_CROWT|nr:Long-chain-fatty-acid--CoA ligase [Crocosphaera watsonii WH 0401]